MAKLNSPSDMMAAVSDSMKARTGKTLDEWVQVVMKSGLDPLDQKGVRNWLKSEHGIAQNTQWAIADASARAAGWVRPSVEGYIDSQYTGDKAALRPIFDKIRQLLEAWPDVTAEGRGGYTPFVHGRQFAAVQAAKNRVELGLRFTNPPESDLIKPAKAPGMSTHKLVLTSPEEVTDAVEQLLRLAYEQNA